jgi:hypothetical protein
MLKDNEEQRLEYSQLLSRMRTLELANFQQIHFSSPAKSGLEQIRFGRKASEYANNGYLFVFLQVQRRIDLHIISA